MAARQGAIVSRLIASAPLLALVPAASINGGISDEEPPLPRILVKDHDPVMMEWYTESDRWERHKVTAEIHAEFAAPPEESSSPDPADPAETIAARVEEFGANNTKLCYDSYDGYRHLPLFNCAAMVSRASAAHAQLRPRPCSYSMSLRRS